MSLQPAKEKNAKERFWERFMERARTNGVKEMANRIEDWQFVQIAYGFGFFPSESNRLGNSISVKAKGAVGFG